MTRNLKALGLALVAVFAMSAMAASSASATDVFTSENSPETITGTSEKGHLFTITSPHLEVECSTATFHGDVNDGATEGTFTPEYTGTPARFSPSEETTHEGHCGSSLGEVNVDMNGCAYILTGNTDTDDPTGSGQKDATIWIECPGTNEIKITTTIGVTLSVPAQTPTHGGVTYTNEGGKVKVKATVTGITYTCETKFICELGGLKTENNNADYTGEVLVHGKEPISWSEE